MHRVTIIASSSAVRAAINGAALEPSERLRVISVAGSARRMTTATIRVASADRQKELYNTLKDGITKAGALAVVTQSQPRPRGTIARMRPAMFRTGDGGWRCPALGGAADAWPQRLHEMLAAKGWVDETAVGLLCVGATPWIEVLVRVGRWREIESWANAHRVAFDYDDTPAMWGVLIPALEQDPVREADRLEAAQVAIGLDPHQLETGWGEPTRVEFDGQSYVKAHFEAPQNWVPVHKGWRLTEDDGSEFLVRLIAQRGCPDYADAEMVTMQLSTPPPPRPRPPIPPPPSSSSHPTSTTASAASAAKDSSKTLQNEVRTADGKSRKRRRDEPKGSVARRREPEMQVEGDDAAAASPPRPHPVAAAAPAAAAAVGASIAVDEGGPPPAAAAAGAALAIDDGPPHSTPLPPPPPPPPSSSSSSVPPRPLSSDAGPPDSTGPRSVGSSSRTSSTPPAVAYYAVHNGNSGDKIYLSWPTAQTATKGASKCEHRKFPTEEAARAFLADHGVKATVEIIRD